MPRLKKEVKRDYTIIHNAMIRDTNLGATERGLLITMLSLPESWDFSIRGLMHILPDGLTKISTALKNLEKAGYLIRRRIYENGKIADWEYVFSDE
ncbi:MAG: helix-turn-helix domain-containing protein, partial [Ruminiclostridium sp.]|nr:helix-turn-helix domain-containing protein [Ruminiclostridium sp.]